MKAIREIRAIQESAAQLAVSRANRRLQEELEQEARTAEQLGADQEAWRRCLADPMAGLTVAVAWAQEVNRTEAIWRHDQQKVRLAEGEKSLRSDAWSRALAQAEAATTLSKTVDARVRRLSEEARLAELADRVSRQGSAA